MMVIGMSEINYTKTLNDNANELIIRTIDPTVELAENAMLRHRPDLFDEWDFEKNDELGLNVYKMTYGSGKKVWWNCTKCGSNYERTIEKTVQSFQCIYCRGYKVNHTNSLATLNPQLALEWHPFKNGELTPNDVTCGSGAIAWWLGRCGHEWKATVLKRAGRGDKCPFCSNKKVLIGFNDMWTTNPKLAGLLANPDNGYKYTEGSNVRVEWKCSECKIITAKLVINSINREGLSCPVCSDGISYGEKFVCCVLESASLNFEFQKEFVDWSNGKRYDFYLPKYNWIIEVHGMQHYGIGFESLGGRTLEEEQENDKYKETLAKANGIEEYIVIDARESSAESILNSIEDSKLRQIVSIEEIDKQYIEKRISTSLVRIASQMWCKGIPMKAIAQKLKLSRVTIRKYLKKGRAAGLCDYDEQESSVKHGRRSVVQLSPDGKYIATWNTVKEASNFVGVSSSSIGRCARGGRPTSAGFKWMYTDDYYKEAK